MYGESNQPHMNVFLRLYHQPYPKQGGSVAVYLEEGRGKIVERPLPQEEKLRLETTTAAETVSGVSFRHVCL